MTLLALWIIGSNAIDIIGMDMNVVFGVQQILLGHPLYQRPDIIPYAITQYSPIYYYLVALSSRLTGVGAGNVLAVSAIARAVSTGIAAALISICYLFLRRRCGALSREAFVSVAFILCGTANWYFAVRPDGLATLLTITAFFLVTSERLNLTRLFAVAMLTVSAVLAKQTGVFAATAIIAFFSFRREWKNLGLFLVMLAVMAVLGVGLLLLTGPAIRANIIDGVNNGISWRSALMMAYRPTYYWFAPLLACAFAAVPHLFRVRATGGRTANILGISLVLSLVMSVVSALKRGSAENYFNELVILSVFAFVMSYLSNKEVRAQFITMPQLTAAFSIYLGTFFLIRAGHQVYTTYLYHRISPETRLTSQLPPANYVRTHITPGRYALGFAVGLSNAFPEGMIAPEKDLADAAQRRELVDYTNFANDLRSGRIQYAVFRNDEVPKSFLRLSLSSFKPVRKFRYYTVYEFHSQGH